MRPRLIFLLTCALLSILVAPGLDPARLGAAADSSAVALRGATVVVGNGQVLPGATVVLRGGLIEAVGATAAIPAGARDVDLKGAFVYPGLIDALSDQGLLKPSAEAKEPEPADTDSAAMFADVRAADLLDPAVRDLATWRDAGILAVNVAPSRGIFMGQTAVISLNGQGPDRMVVRAPVAMRMALQGLGFRNRRRGQGEPGGVYPTRLIGVLAYIRQTLLDAHHYDDQLKLYEASPRGLERPSTAKGREALLPVARRTMALMFPAEEQREVVRVLDIADETKVNCVVVGGYEAAELAAPLNERKIPVVVSLNYPGPEADVHPEFEYSVRVMRLRERAPRAAGELAKAGVRIAFASAGLRNGADFLANLRLAVRQALPKDAALRAATLGAAEILGVERQLGSIEPGKIANLVVADGDLFEDQSRIRSVFVDGREFDVAAQKRAAARPAPAAAPPNPEPPMPPTPREFLVRNATVMTATRGTIKGGSILVRDGKIAAVGPNVTAGAGVPVVDLTGKWVTPGLIDAHAHYPTDSHNEATSNVTAQTSLRDNLNPTDPSLYRVLAGGVTTINVFHGSVNPIGGKSAIIKMRYGKDAHGLLFEGARPSLKMALKEFAPRQGSSAPASFMGVETVIREALLRAREYRQRWDDYEKARAATVSPLMPPRRDLALEALAEVLKGDRLLRVHAEEDPRGMLMLMRVAEQFGFRVRTYEHAPAAYRIADELRRHGASASIFANFGVETSYNAAVLTRKGVLVSINSDGEVNARDLAQQAGLLRTFGLTEEEALATVTINPAKQMDIDKRVGSIEVGKDADFVVWTRHPLSVYALADQVYIDGQLYFSREQDRLRRAWLEAERKRLTGAGGRDRSPSGPPAAPGALGERALPAPTEGRDSSPSRPSIAEGRNRSASGPSATYVIQHAKVFTVSGPTLDDATIVVSDGHITAVGASVPVPAGAHVIDGKGLSVYPGLFDADSLLGMTESNPESQFGQFTPHMAASTSFVPDSEMIPVVRATGVTHVLARPARGVIPGQGEIMNLAGWTGEEMLVRPRAALVIVFPTVGELQYTEDERFQVTPWSASKSLYDRRLRQLKDFFQAARAYAAAKTRGGAGFERDASFEAMLPVLDRKETVVLETTNHVDIRNAVQFAKEENLDYLIAAPFGAWRVADFLKENDVRVLLSSPGLYPEAEDDPYDVNYRTAAILHEKGVRFAISTAAQRLAQNRQFAYSVGVAIAHGLPRDAALRAVTLTPAEFLGVADRLGSVEKGKLANLVVAAGDILDGAEVKYVFVNGEPASLRTRETELYEKYRERPAPRTVKW